MGHVSASLPCHRRTKRCAQVLQVAQHGVPVREVVRLGRVERQHAVGLAQVGDRLQQASPWPPAPQLDDGADLVRRTWVRYPGGPQARREAVVQGHAPARGREVSDHAPMIGVRSDHGTNIGGLGDEAQRAHEGAC